jgi:hypothetical protein
VQSFDPCVWTDPPSQSQTSYQQWDVDGCTPVASPWVKVSGFSGKGWKIYCPSSAPYSWAALPIGAIQFWFGDGDVKATFVFSENYNPGWSDHSVFNYDTGAHHWKFTIGCSPIDQGSSAKHEYSNGEGPTGKPVPCCGLVASGLGALPAGSARGARPVKGPPVYRIRSARGYEETRELDLRPNGRRRYSVGCAAGHRLRRKRWALGWYTARRPRERDGSASAVALRSPRNRLRLSVRTRGVGRGSVRLQTTILCLR